MVTANRNYAWQLFNMCYATIYGLNQKPSSGFAKIFIYKSLAHNKIKPQVFEISVLPQLNNNISTVKSTYNVILRCDRATTVALENQ